MSNLNSKKPMIYLSHPMRGKKGDTEEGNSDQEYQNTNSEIAIMNLQWLRFMFPEVNWYCPGEVEIPVQTAYLLGFMDVEQILTMDCKIIEERCAGNLVHRWEASVGSDREEACSRKKGIPILVYEDSKYIWNCSLKKIREFVNSVLFEAKQKRQ